MVTKTRVQRTHTLRPPAPRNLSLSLPPPEYLAFYAGIGLMAAVGITDWPVLVAVAIGHTLVTVQHNKVLQSLGEALEEA